MAASCFISYGNTLFNEQIYEKVTLSSLSKPSHFNYNIFIFLSQSLFSMWIAKHSLGTIQCMNK